MRTLIPAICIIWITGCASSARDTAPATDPPVPDSPPALPAAPWSAAPLPAGAAPEPLPGEWRAADNRATCAPLAPVSIAPHSNATPRAATFAGGWAVAWDLPGLRSAFGIAGTGVAAAEPAYDEWPHRLQWTDGSSAGYGPEGGTGPKQLAYLRIPGQACLYNVWSNIGREHLEQLLDQLRFVQAGRWQP